MTMTNLWIPIAKTSPTTRMFAGTQLFMQCRRTNDIAFIIRRHWRVKRTTLFDWPSSRSTGEFRSRGRRSQRKARRVPLWAARGCSPVKLVLGSNPRLFKHVLDEAQQILRKTFGMELVELRSRAELDRAVNGNADDDADEARNGTGIKRRG